MADQSLPGSSLSPLDSLPSHMEEKPVKRGLTTFYTLANLGSWIALITPIAVTMALRVQQIDPAHKETDLGLILGVGALMPVFITPLVGLLSDRTTLRLGMRRPWIVGGAILGFLSLLLTATVPTIPLLMLGWCLTQMMFSVTGAAMGAIIPDHVPEDQRGKLSGLIGMAQQLGTVLGIAIATVVNGNLFLAFMIPAALGLISLLLLAFTMPDRHQTRAELPTLDLFSFVKSFWISPRRYPDFAWAFVSRFLVSFGLAIYSNYTVYFLQERLHYTAEQVTSLLLVGVLVTVATTTLAAILSGIASDRLKRRKVFVIISALLYMAGAAIVAFASSFPIYLVGGGLAGAAIGAYSAVDMAMITQLLPENGANAAKDMGVFGIASVLPQSLAPAMAPLFLSIGGSNNYVALYLAAALFGIFGAVTVWPIKGVR